jgi:phenylpropionate dioxygenase-like ring-hydroxylating dioxygenase large terminal subunit
MTATSASNLESLPADRQMLEETIKDVDRQLEEIPAGGDDPHKFDCQEVWYPVHYVEDLDKSKPTRFTLLSQDLVIWWERSSQSWRVFADRCPHRLAPLSEGRIAEDGLLECPYHGWAFQGDGSCDRIPQQLPDNSAETSSRACVQSFPTTVKQELLFVYPGKPENAAKTKVPIVEPLEESPEKWVCLNTFRDLPYDAMTLLENVIDPSHVPFTHHRSVGNRANASPVELELVSSGKHGFTGVWKEGPRRGTLGKQDTTFIAPGLMWHDLTSKQFGRTLTVVYATPIRKGECRLFARFPFQFSSKIPSLFIKLTPRWYSHLGQNDILEDDQIFLHHQERYLEASGGSPNFAKAFYLPTKADLFVNALRNWVNEFEADPFPGSTLSPVLSKEQLLDRYHSHTVNCQSCSKALKVIQKLRKAALAIALLALSTIPFINLVAQESRPIAAIASTLMILFAGISWFGLGKLQKRFYQGRAIPPRNL